MCLYMHVSKKVAYNVISAEQYNVFLLLWICSSRTQTCLPQLTLKSSISSSSAQFGNVESSFRKLKTMVSDSWAGAIMAYTHSIYIPNIYLSYMYLLKMGTWVAQWVRSYSTERDIPWSITVIVIMSRRVMGINILNSCRWSGGNKTPGVNLVIKCVVLQVN